MLDFLKNFLFIFLSISLFFSYHFFFFFPCPPAALFIFNAPFFFLFNLSLFLLVFYLVFFNSLFSFAPSAWAVKYADCISADEEDTLPMRLPVDRGLRLIILEDEILGMSSRWPGKQSVMWPTILQFGPYCASRAVEVVRSDHSTGHVNP